MTGNLAAPSVSDKQTLKFVVFSDDWGEHPSSCQHLFRHIARQYPVIWVNTIGMRTPKFRATDAAKVWRKLSKMLLSRQRIQLEAQKLQLRVYQPFMLPYSRVAAVRDFNARSVMRTLNRAGAMADFDRTIVVASAPNAGDYCAALPDARVVYYCVDDFTHWPEIDAEIVHTMERKLIERADILVAASDRLYERLASCGKPLHLLTHGVDIEIFGRHTSTEHSCLERIRTPRVGFFGLFDARLDQDLLVEVARRMPETSFVFAGPVEGSVQRLSKCANVHFAGPIPYAELPYFIAGLAVLIIPYKVGVLADSLAPLKLKEYLVTGKPVISTPIAAARLLAAQITVASTADEWIAELCRGISTEPEGRRESIIESSMDRESWSEKAREFLRLSTISENDSPIVAASRRIAV